MVTPQQTGLVVVTGASSGIGEACAIRLDQLGFRVFAGVRRKQDGIALQQKTSHRLVPILLDVTDTASILSAKDSIAAAAGDVGLIALVNNAGIAVAGPLEFLPISELRYQLEVNVIGQITVTQALLPLLRQGKGRIINIGSLGGRIAFPFNGPYHASKFALEALSDCLRVELRPWGIPISLIEPGIISTPLWEKSQSVCDALIKKLPEPAGTFYGRRLLKGLNIAGSISKTGTSADEVARSIVHAITAVKPKTRYLVGRGTRIGTLVFEHLPDRLRDFLITQFLSVNS